MNQPTTITIDTGNSTVTLTLDEDGVTIDAATAEAVTEPPDDECTDIDCPIHGPGASPEKAMARFMEGMSDVMDHITSGKRDGLVLGLQACAFATQSIATARKQGFLGQGELDLMAEAVDEAKAELRKRGIPIPMI